jgi:hypothetical protein
MTPADLIPCTMVWIGVLLALDAAGVLRKGGKP